MSGGRKRVLLVPETRPGHGSGHLKRCLELATALGSAAETAFLGSLSIFQSKLADRLPNPAVLDESAAAARTWDLVVVDKRNTSIEDYAKFRSFAPVVGIDAGGPGRARMSYLIDSLPQPRSDPAAAPNESGPAFLSLPVPRSDGRSGKAGILVTFGGEDAGLLTEKCCAALLQTLPRLRPGSEVPQITAVRGPLFESSRLRADPFVSGNGDGKVGVLEAPQRLGDLIGDYGLVVTSFGLTAFEARAARVPVLLVNATRYHDALGRRSGFRSTGTGSPDATRLTKAISEWQASGSIAEPEPLDKDWAADQVQAAAKTGSLVADTILRLDPSGATGCPVCGRTDNPAEARFAGRSYFRCASCGMLYLENCGGRKMSYARDYFFDDYRKQYGKTYLDDFANIRQMAVPRLERISHLAAAGDLLDVGCAFGPFLAEAASKGYRPFGVDISEDAAAHVRAHLGTPAVAVSIRDFDPEAEFGIRRFDVITLWYVIEHFPDVRDILRGLNGMLKPGGVLAFSTPSGAGVSARLHRRQFFAQSPEDHFTIWEPRRTGSVLRRFGFTLKSVRVTGHHPERFRRERPNRLQSCGEPTENRYMNPLIFHAAGTISRSFGLGDTFEAYAVKTGEPTS